MSDDRHLSGGDAFAVFVLLLFMVGWVAGWVWAASTEKHITGGVAFWYLVIIVLPALWAGHLIGRIVEP